MNALMQLLTWKVLKSKLSYNSTRTINTVSGTGEVSELKPQMICKYDLKKFMPYHRHSRKNIKLPTWCSKKLYINRTL